MPMSRCMMFLLTAAVATAACPGPVHAETIHVPADYPSIQEAIDAATLRDLDVIEIAAGTYLLSSPINTLGKSVIIRGEVGRDGRPATIIDGQSTQRVFECTSGEGPTTMLEHLTIRNGASTFGGGLLLDSSSPTITNCLFIGNSADVDGGGVFAFNSQASFINCTFQENQASLAGGGVASLESDLILTHSIFISNSAPDGGGVHVNNASITMSNCDFELNEAILGGALSMLGGQTAIIGCTFNQNSAEDSGSAIDSISQAEIASCSFWGNDCDGLGTVRLGMQESLVDSPFSFNQAAAGGGIHSTGMAEISGCMLVENMAELGGGAASAMDSATYSNCLFTMNQSEYGGAVHAFESMMLMDDCTLESNLADHGGGLFEFGSSITFRDGTIMENESLYQGGGATPPQDVTAIASSRPKQDDVPTVAELVATHRVVPSIARALAQRIQDAASQPKSPLRPLLETMPEGLESLRKLVPLDGPELQKQLADKDSPWKAIRDADALYPENVKPELVELRSTARRLAQTTFPKPRTAMIAFDNKAPADLRIHVAGDNRRLGDVVERGFPRVLVDQASRAAGQRAVPAKASGRLELARWLTRPGHPLVPRVIANRVWQWHFGEGLVRTADNFGQLGEEPTHPRLLDHLAALLISDGWSLKALHRRIVLSSVYRQSSRWREGPMEVDADNRLLWRMNRRRLEAEPYRDAMLAASGGLDSEMAGTLQTWKPKEFSVDDANKETARFQTSRRSLYLPVVRTTMHEMMELFDVGDPNSITSRRANTTVPPQALFLLNNPFVQERSQGLAERVSAWSDDETERIRRAWWLVLSRPPSPSELGRARQYLAATRRPDGTGEKLAWTALAWALFSLNEFLYVD